MNGKLLIDAIVRQTTVLVAQLSTAAGIRAPLAHVADEVFVSLAREIEAQGVGRKVVADMFGLALRTYQKKVQRLAESVTERERTVWEAVLDYVGERETATRDEVLRAFERDGEAEVISVLGDLVGSGLLHASGRGVSAIYGITSDAERKLFARAADADAASAIAWATIRGTPGTTTAGLAELLRLDLEETRGAVERLVSDGRVTQDGAGDDAALSAVPLVIPIGADLGWEAAVYDHFRAVASAIAAKVRRGRTRSAEDDVVGGTTLSFRIHPGHPAWDRVRSLLVRVRTDAIALWDEVEAHNVLHPVADDAATLVWFYVGQYLEPDHPEER
ncbi:MAG TPA: hypothetical protein VHE30_13815 [Polyangiaceae bacterium]|nr:hypothetical protein [Polyangiaceae bacterium]